MNSGISSKKIEGLIFIIVALSPIAMGSVHLPVVIAFLCVLLLVFFHQYKFGELKNASIGWISIFIAIVCAIQLVPIPAFFSIQNMDLFSTYLGQDELPWRPLSMDPYQTADRGLRFLTIGLLAFSVASIAKGNFYRRANFWVLVGGWFVLAFGLVLWLSQTTTFFGFEQSVRFRSASPFVNTNHGASYFALLTLGAILNFENGKSKPFAILSGITFLCVFLFHGSLGVDLVFGSVLLVYGLLKFRPNTKQLLKGSMILTSIVVFLILLFWMDVLPIDALEQLIRQSSSRLELTKGGFGLARSWPIFGAGLGSTDTSILAQIDWTRIRPASIPTIENELLEFFGTGGILVGGVILGAHLFLSYDGLRTAVLDRKKRRHRWHGLFWLFFVGIVSLHFPWFTLGLAFPFVLFIQSTSTRLDPLRSPLIFVIGIVVLLLIFLSATLFWQGRTDLNARPLASETWINLATESVKKGDLATALQFAEQAKTVDPRPRTHHYLARLVAKNGDTERAIGLYSVAFADKPANNRLITDMLTDIPTASDRNRILEKQNDEGWLRAARISQYFFDADQAIALAFDTIQNQNRESAARRFAAEVFIELNQIELARIWTETQNVDGELLTSIYLEQNDAEAFFAATQSTIDAKDLPLYYILKNHNKILKIDPTRGRTLLKRSHNAYCKTPLDAGRRRICWQVDASLKVADGDLKGAEKIYQRIFNRSGNPRELGAFYLSQKKCSKINTLLRQQTKAKPKEVLSNLYRKCTQH